MERRRLGLRRRRARGPAGRVGLHQLGEAPTAGCQGGERVGGHLGALEGDLERQDAVQEGALELEEVVL